MGKFLKYAAPALALGAAFLFTTMERSTSAEISGKRSVFSAVDKKLNKDKFPLDVYAEARSELYRQKILYKLKPFSIKSYNSPEDELLRLLEMDQAPRHGQIHKSKAGLIIESLVGLDTPKSLDYAAGIACSDADISGIAARKLFEKYAYGFDLDDGFTDVKRKAAKGAERLKSHPGLLERLRKELHPLDPSKGQANVDMMKIFAATKYQKAMPDLIAIAGRDYKSMIDYSLEAAKALEYFPSPPSLQAIIGKTKRLYREGSDDEYTWMNLRALEMAKKLGGFQEIYACMELTPAMEEKTIKGKGNMRSTLKKYGCPSKLFD